MAARGPDGRGAWISADARVGLGHRRLAIIDLSTGRRPADGQRRRQPGRDVQRRDLQLPRAACRARGAGPRVPQPVRHRGPAAPLRREGRGHGARSARHVRLRHLGCAARRRCSWRATPTASSRSTTPTTAGRSASPRRSRRCWPAGAISREPEPAGQVGFFLCGSVPEPFTSYRAIRALPAGSHPDGSTPAACARAAAHYHSIAAVYGEAAEPTPASDRARGGDGRDPRRRAATACAHHLVADVPVGAFLSAGIDSGALVGLMRDAGQARHSDGDPRLRRVPRHRGRRGAARRGGGPHLRHAAHHPRGRRGASSGRTCRASSRPWTSPASTASTPGSSPRPRARWA